MLSPLRDCRHRPPPSAPPMLDSLPPEIYSSILLQVPSQILQQTVLSLSRALPRSPVPTYHLFQHIRLKHAEQVIQLHRRLRKAPEDAVVVQEFALETWSADADVVINLVSLLKRLQRIILFIGPNFAPEHLEEIFTRPLGDSKFISLRFRPYVQKATYYQFLKGAYFDSTLLALSRWPAASIPTLSFVQDPVPPELGPSSRSFAQPLVFFRLDAFTTLFRAHSVSNLHSLRLRVPGRTVGRFLYDESGVLPALEVLDLSTCYISLHEIDEMLVKLAKIRYLILDGCGEHDWAAIGKSIATTGVRRAKEREKVVKAWLEVESARTESEGHAEVDMNVPIVGDQRRVRPGRRGLATATVSIRASPPRSSASLPSVSVAPSITPGRTIPKIRILPPLPSVTSLCMSASLVLSDTETRAQFERGWIEGINQLNAVRARLWRSHTNGVRVMAFKADEDGPVGLDGLQDVSEEETHWEMEEAPQPSLCLMGRADETSAGKQHPEGCAHHVGRTIWDDEL